MVLLLWLVAYVAIDAAMQGKLTKLFRLYIPVVHQPTINLCLHVGAPLLYALYSWHVCGPDARSLLLAVAVRLCLFDPVLNLVKGDPVFAVGSSALTDRALRAIAGARASWLSGAVRVAAVAAAALLLSSCSTSRPEPAAAPWGVAPQPPLPIYGDGGANTGKLPENVDSRRGNVDSSQPKQGELTPLQIAQLPRSVQRQYRKNLRAQPATVPEKLGKGATFAPAATTVATGYKAGGPTTATAPGGTTTVATAAKNGQAAAGEGIVQEKVEPPKPTLWQRVTGLFTGLTSTVGWVALAVVALHAFGPGIGYKMGWARRLVA